MRALSAIAATVTAVALSAVGVAPAQAVVPRRLPVVTKRFLVECGPDHQRKARRIRRDYLEQRHAIEQSTWEVICADPDGTAHGPAVRVRHTYRSGRAALAARTYFLAPQLVWSGAYKHGRKHGQWRQFSRAGEELGRVTLTMGSGTWRGWRSDGQLAAEGGIVEDRKQGKWTFWNAAGDVAMQGTYAGGRRDGRWRSYWSAGLVRDDISYLDGKTHGLSTVWHNNGEKRSEGRFNDGLKDGEWAYWNRRGHLLGVNRLDKGSGRWLEWYNNGTKRSEGWMRRGRRHGHWIRYSANGHKSEEGEYEDGQRDRSSWVRYNRFGVKRTSRRSRSILKYIRAGRGKKSKAIVSAFGTRGATFLGRGRVTGLVGVGGRGGVAGGGGGRGIRATGSGGGSATATISRLKRMRPGGMPNVSIKVTLPKGRSLDPNRFKDAQTTARMCTLGYDIRRLQQFKRRNPSRPFPPLRDGARAELQVDSTGRVGIVRMIQRGKQLDAAWHRCLSIALRQLRFPARAAAAGATVPVVIQIR